MATLVLTTLGSALGGPVGGALGSLIGQSIDRNLFGPPTRRGPRLGDLAIQTSSYGTPMPRIYGRMRVAGTVVWASDLREEEVASGGGKSGAAAVGYAYSASFAVALSSRGAQSVGRIWADGKLLRGADGTFQLPVKFRFHGGGERQAVDPLIASIEGAGGSPAFRGIALAVFEDLALADFGNRIPSLTFELIADETSPLVGSVISDVARGAIEATGGQDRLTGFAALGTDRRAAIEPLVELWDHVYHDDGTVLRSVEADEVAAVIGDAARAGCAVAGERRPPRIEREQEAADGMPTALTVDYHDPERDFQAGRMRATSASGGRSVRGVDSASALSAATAKSLASDALARRWAGRDLVTLRLAPEFMGLKPGQIVSIIGAPGRYRLEAVTLDGLVAVVEARRVPSDGQPVPADPGRSAPNPLVSLGQSVPILFDLPALAADGEGLGVTLALGSTGRFRPTAVIAEVNGQPLATMRIDRPAICGAATTVLAKGAPNVIDRINSVDVSLSDPAALLYNVDSDALAMGANAMAVGAEIIQFGRALALGGGAFRLSHLARGLGATEWAMESHVAGEPVVLLQPERLQRIRLDPAMLGAEVSVQALGLADDPSSPPTARLRADGESLCPPSPCHVTSASDATTLTLRWARRRRASLAWWAAEMPDETEFEITIVRGGGTLTRVTSVPEVAIAKSDIAALGVGQIRVEVVERGAVPSRPALLYLNG